MFHLLQPLWILATSGIIIPLAIHFWNVRQGKILRVGSVAFLNQPSKKYATSLKLTQLLLLILRCLLIVLLAFLLAKPVFDQSFEKAGVKGWVLIDKENFSPAYYRFQPLIDSLIQAGYEFHYFNEGFKKEKLSVAVKNQKDSLSKLLSYRSLLKQLDRVAPAKLPVHLFTPGYLNRFAGKQEPASLNLYWHTFTPTDSVADFISAAYAISMDSLRVITGSSRPSGTFYKQYDVSLKKNVNGDIQITRDSGLFVAYKNGRPVAVDTSVLSITIFSGKYAVDAMYVKAAVEAVHQFSRRRIRIILAGNPEAVPSSQNWLFWLSELPVPATAKAGNIFKYQDNKIKNTNSWINTSTSISNGEEKIALIKLVASQLASAEQLIWRDGFGNPVLSLEKGNVNTYRLFTHIDPSWTDLPWSSRFPQLIFRLLYPAEKKIDLPDEQDKRIISERQLLASNFVTVPGLVKQKFITTDASPVFWLLIFVIFSLERFMALRTGKEVVYG